MCYVEVWIGGNSKEYKYKVHIGYWWESQKERNHFEDQDVGGWTILK
jgi:hypothetical protein